MTYLIRPMVPDDLPQVQQIEQESFTHPWAESFFRHEITVNQVARYLVACENDVILGYLGLWLIVGEIHITTIASRLIHRRRGVGELLLISSIELALEHNAYMITLEVRQSNVGALALYQKYGFHEGGLRPGYYSETGEDALIMTTENINSTSYKSKLKQLKETHFQRYQHRI